MADSVKLVAKLVGITTDVTKDDVLNAAMAAVPGLTKGAALIVRDTNGKVIQVELTLPSTSSAAATAAIAANAGVATVITTDIQPGNDGYEGTADSKALLESQGAVFTLDPGVTEAFVGDSTVIDHPLVGFTEWVFTKGDAVPASPNLLTSEVKVAFSNITPTTVDATLRMEVANNGYTADMFAPGEGGGFLRVQNLTSTQIVNVPAHSPGQTDHIYRIDYDGTNFKYFIDDVEKASIVAGAPSPSLTSQSVRVNIRGFSIDGTTVPQNTLDYIQWTEKV